MESKKFPQRKSIRLKDYSYSHKGAYFITICVKGRRAILSGIVGCGVHDAPQIILSEYGIIAKKYIDIMSQRYDNIFIDRYVIMPNHIHMIIIVRIITVRRKRRTLRMKQYLNLFRYSRDIVIGNMAKIFGNALFTTILSGMIMTIKKSVVTLKTIILNGQPIVFILNKFQRIFEL